MTKASSDRKMKRQHLRLVKKGQYQRQANPGQDLSFGVRIRDGKVLIDVHLPRETLTVGVPPEAACSFADAIYSASDAITKGQTHSGEAPDLSVIKPTDPESA